MKSRGMVSLAAISLVLAMASSHAEAKDGNRKSALIGAGAGVAAGVAGTVLYNKYKASQQQETTGSVRPARSLRDDDDDEDEPPVRRRTTQRGVDQTSTGSVQKARYEESCNVKSVDLFDKKGHFVKTERMRVCQ